MVEISDAAKLKACELANEASCIDFVLEAADIDWEARWPRAFARYIQQVSDAVKEAESKTGALVRDAVVRCILAPFILPEPADPLVEALRASVADPEQFAARLRDNLAKRGLKIVEASK